MWYWFVYLVILDGVWVLIVDDLLGWVLVVGI